MCFLFFTLTGKKTCTRRILEYYFTVEGKAGQKKTPIRKQGRIMNEMKLEVLQLMKMIEVENLPNDC